ncbi:MAG: rod shape-determining protein MreD [Tepidanaerobacteraceae bacterium]|nr:rod shape-determining protein MreD [Tepidanaerobacteraceae bacterium]
MRTVAYVFVIITLLLLQTTLLNFSQIYGVKPDLPLVFALCMAMIKGEKVGAVTGFFNGLLEDILFGRFLGLNTIVKCITTYVLGYGSRDIYKGPAVLTMALVFLGSILYNILFMLLAFFTNEISHPWYYFLPITIPSALLNMIISPLIYLAITKMERFFNYYFDTRY